VAKAVVLVTGAVAAGKTTLLERLFARVRGRFRTCGFVSRGGGRAARPGSPAGRYCLEVLGSEVKRPWADRLPGGGFRFDESSRERVEQEVRGALARGKIDVFIIDEIGFLELGGAGFAGLFRDAIAACDGVVVAAVKKEALEGAVGAFGLDGPLVVDLDLEGGRKALRRILGRIDALDAERIGLFAGACGLVEVGLGSFLHAYRVPLKGHVLAYLQNLLLVTFGKSLGGRGLVRIALVSAMLKAFSPAGSRLRPMVYIFLQGAAFALPVRVLGWNVAAVVAGSILMSWLTLLLSLAVDVIAFGKSIWDAYAGAAALVGSWIGARSLSIWHLLAALMALKAAVAVGLALAAYYGDFNPVIARLARRVRRRSPEGDEAPASPPRRPLRAAALKAMRELVRPRFLLGFFVSALLILFFVNLSKVGLASVILRGLCISYVGLLLAHWIDVKALVRRLDRHGHGGLGSSLPIAFGAMSGARPPESGRCPSGGSPDRDPGAASGASDQKIDIHGAGRTAD
jgi:nucleoside-triphosphatase THEP1